MQLSRVHLLSIVAMTLTAAVACSSSTTATVTAPLPSASPSPSTQEQSSPPAGSATFTSETYGYSLALPNHWTSVQASASWDGKGAPGSDDAVVDQFIGPAAAYSWAYAAPTTKGLAAYATATIEATVEDHADTCPADPDAEDSIQIGGQPGTLLAWNCGVLVNQAVTVQHGVGFFFGFLDQSVHAATDAADRKLFLKLLSSVQFFD